MGGVVHPVRHLGEELEPGAVSSTSTTSSRAIRRSALFTHRATSPAPPPRNLTAAQRPLRAPDRPREHDRRRRAARRGDRRVRLHGHRHAARRGCARPASSCRTRGASEPNLTINVGLRYDLQYPFYPLNSLLLDGARSTTSAAGLGARSPTTRCNLFQPGVMPGAAADVHAASTKGTRAYDTDYNNFAPSVGFAWTPERRPGLPRRAHGTEGDFVVRGGYTRAFSRPGMNDFTGQLRREPGRHDSDANRDTRQPGQPRRACRCCSASTARLGPPPFPSIAGLSADRRRHRGHQPVRSEHPGAVRRLLDGRHPAQRRQQHRRRGALRRHARRATTGQTLNYNEINIFENGFLNEFRVAQANLQANIAAGRGNTFAYHRRARARRRCRRSSRSSTRRRGASRTTRRRTRGANWTNKTFLNFLADSQPESVRVREQPMPRADGQRGLPRATRPRPASRRTSSSPIRTCMGGADRHDERRRDRATTRCSSSCAAAMRRACSSRRSYVYGHGDASDFQTFRRAAVLCCATPGRPGDLTHAVQVERRLRPAVRPGPPLRQRRERLRRSHHRRLADRPDRRGSRAAGWSISATSAWSA